jgi:hypothetical protein
MICMMWLHVPRDGPKRVDEEIIRIALFNSLVQGVQVTNWPLSTHTYSCGKDGEVEHCMQG